MLMTIISVLLSAGVLYGAYHISKGKVDPSKSTENNEATLSKIQDILKQIEDLLTNASQYVSKGQLEYIEKQTKDLESQLEQEKNSVQNLESRLENAQKLVEDKEQAQQELKTTKEDEEATLQLQLQNYSQASNEAMTLEQQLASSLQNLDALIGQLQVAPEQRAILEDLSVNLTAAGARLRDLITESTTVTERLGSLVQQHKDLEEEYTRLVEQQLGE